MRSASNTGFMTAPATLELAADAVHVWQARVGAPGPSRESLRSTLSPEEHGRLARFVSERDADRFATGRGLLRVILGRYLGSEPGKLVFEYNKYGKPHLGGGRDRGPAFSVSHSGDLLLLAFAGNSAPVGVDLERIRDDVDFERIANRFFSPRETAQLAALPAAGRRAAFFACWTRKEAFVKAKGAGLYMGLGKFDVTVAPDAEPRIEGCSVPELTAEIGQWSLHDLAVGPGYKAALAVRMANAAVARYLWA